MGESKRRAAAREQLNEAIQQVDIPRLAAAIQKLATAASGHVGSDCYAHSTIAQEILARLGVQARLVVGYAAWRVGDGDGDVILHAPAPGMVEQPGGVPYHVWLEIDDHLLDLTTYSLPTKAAQLDALDGGHTSVTWFPDYLFVPRKSISSIESVIQLWAGIYYYSHDPEVEARIIGEAPELDETDVQAAWLLYQNPEVQAIGPNSLT
jgi:hypothetical protein